MSADATAHAYRHAPFTAQTMLVLLAIADTVSDQHDNEFWMKYPGLAAKARVHRDTVRKAVLELIEAGWLQVVYQSQGKHPSRYRFMFDDRRPVLFDGRRVRPQPVDKPGDEPAAMARVGYPQPAVSAGTTRGPVARTRGTAAGLNNPKEPNRTQGADEPLSTGPAPWFPIDNCIECHGHRWITHESADGHLTSVECTACPDAPAPDGR